MTHSSIATNDATIYKELKKYILPDDLLETYGYPLCDPEQPTTRRPPPGIKKTKIKKDFDRIYKCLRCKKKHHVDPNGLPDQTHQDGVCVYHPSCRGPLNKYLCCNLEDERGCTTHPVHVHLGEYLLDNYEGYVQTLYKPDREPNNHGVYALDCEMCHTTHGLELTHITLVDHRRQVIYKSLVRPRNPILDYNTKFTGFKSGDLDHVTTTLEDVQRDLLEILSSKSILIGHSLDNDMRALKMFHGRFIDTTHLFPHKRGLPFKRALRNLVSDFLAMEIQNKDHHSSQEDATAALELVLWKKSEDKKLDKRIIEYWKRSLLLS